MKKPIPREVRHSYHEWRTVKLPYRTSERCTGIPRSKIECGKQRGRRWSLLGTGDANNLKTAWLTGEEIRKEEFCTMVLWQGRQQERPQVFREHTGGEVWWSQVHPWAISTANSMRGTRKRWLQRGHCTPPPTGCFMLRGEHQNNRKRSPTNGEECREWTLCPRELQRRGGVGRLPRGSSFFALWSCLLLLTQGEKEKMLQESQAL